MLEEITQPNYKSFMFPRLSNCQKSHIDSIIVFQNVKKKKKISVKLRAVCRLFQMQTSMCGTSSQVKRLHAEAGGLIHLSAAKKKKKKSHLIWFEKNKWNYIWNKSNDLTRVQHMFFSSYSRQN